MVRQLRKYFRYAEGEGLLCLQILSKGFKTVFLSSFRLPVSGYDTCNTYIVKRNCVDMSGIYLVCQGAVYTVYSCVSVSSYTAPVSSVADYLQQSSGAFFSCRSESLP